MENKENHYEGYDDKTDVENNSAVLYERSRIKALAEQRDDVQKKTFTKWINSHLAKSKEALIVKDLFSDLQDGKILLKLLEIISGENLPKATKGKMRIHCIENVGKCLQFLDFQHVYLENLGAHDIVDGNQTLTLGLIWTLILRFQIQYAMPDEYDGTGTTKDALLLWCQMKTAGYKNVSIRNFTTSWKDGLAFNAILHKHDPEIVDFVQMTKATPVENMNTAFEIAEKVYGVPQLLDAKDIAVDQPDERSIMTYIGVLSHNLNKLKKNTVQCKRLGNVINEAITVEEKIKDYEHGCGDLLKWIVSKIDWMDNEELRESLPGVQEQLVEFKSYRLDEKPPKFSDRGALEMKFFEIQTKLRNDNRKMYVPPEGKLVSDVNRAWEELETAEHRAELRLYDELIRQEKLEQLGNRFNRKAQLRETWLQENQRLVQQDVFGDDLVTVDAAIKKHEALEGDIFAHEGRINALGTIVDELDAEKFYKVGEVKDRFEKIERQWDQLLLDLQRRRDRLDRCRSIQVVFGESDYLLDWINEVGSRLHTRDYGKHLLGVDDLLDKHKIVASDVRTLEARVADLRSRMSSVDFDHDCVDPAKVDKRSSLLEDAVADLVRAAEKRGAELVLYRAVWEVVEGLQSDREWAKEVEQMMQSPEVGHDLPSVERLLRRHEQASVDIGVHTDVVEKKLEVAKDARDDCEDEDSDERRALLDSGIQGVEQALSDIKILSIERRGRLEEALRRHQLLADVEDHDVVIIETMRYFEGAEDTGDKLDLTLLYLRQFEEQMVVVEDLGSVAMDLKTRRVGSEWAEAFEKMLDDLGELNRLASTRRTMLDNKLGRFRLLDDIDAIETWIEAKEKFLMTLVTTSDEVDELEVIKHRFDCFLDQMRVNAEKLEVINEQSQRLPEIATQAQLQDRVNHNWNELADLTASKQQELDRSLAFQQFVIECQETCSWIRDKMKVLEWTDELKDDLDGVMQLQRRLGSLQRDVQAVEAKVHYLDGQALQLKADKPEKDEVIDTRITEVNELWAELVIMLKDRDTRLNSSNELQKFLQDLDSFNVWLSSKQKEVASQDIPNTLQEAEKLYSQHQQVKEEIHCWIPEFTRLLKFGRNLSQSKDDPQYLLFNQRLNGLEDGWQMLEKMCADKDITLRQSIDAQTFIRDALQVDSILTKQETFLAKEDMPSTIEGTQEAIRQLETFKTTASGNQPKIESVLSFGESLISNNTLSDKIKNKCEQIRDRWAALHIKIEKREGALQDELKLKVYLEDIMDVEEWIAEKMINATDTSFRDAKDISTRYNRFKDFERELEANRDRVDDVIKAGEVLMSEKPQFQWEIEPKIDAVNGQWSELMQTAKDKSNAMEDANREIIFDETTKSMMSWVTEISSQIITTEESSEEIGLVEINEQMKDQEDKDKQLHHRKKMLNDIADHAVKLKEQYPDREEEFEQIHAEVIVKLTQVEAPMAERREKLSQQKMVQQFLRDMQDEKEWIAEKMNIIDSNKVSPETLQVCMHKIRRLKTLATEIDNHKSRIDDVKEVGQEMINNDHPSSERFEMEINEIDKLWSQLLESLYQSQDFFEEHRIVQEYLVDAGESESWMSEREFDLLKDEKAKDEGGASNAMRRHEALTISIHDYATVICELGERSKQIGNDELPGHNAVAQRQERVDKMYAGLVDMCLDRRMKIEDLIKLYHLLRSIEYLEEWIADRTVVACSHEVGSEFEQCNLLRDRFAEFAIETNDLGGPRVAEAMLMCDKLIEQGHQEAAEIARWKDRINEAWADLLELIETRIQLLKAVWDYFKFMSESAELVDRMREKALLIPEGIGKDAKTVASYQRKHAAFVLEINSLKMHVDCAIETANHLLTFYCGEKEHDLIERRAQLQKLWNILNAGSDNRNNVLMDALDFFRFLSMVRELISWMGEIDLQVHLDDKARDVSGVELIISYHRSLKAEIDSRDENKSICITLGRTLINRRHPNRDDIRKKCLTVVSKHFHIKEDWLERQEHLEMILGVYQFARDAAVAECWLMAQEPQIQTNEVGDSLFETLHLIQKHQSLERTLQTQEDRFDSLKRLTIFEEKQRSLTDDIKLARKNAKEEKLEELIFEFRTPPPTPKEVSRKSSVTDGAQEELIVLEKVAVVDAAPRDLDINTTKREQLSKSEVLERLPQKPQEPAKSMVSRKHEWESSTKKASNRAWHGLYMVEQEKKLSFYKDEKHYQDGGDKRSTYKGEPPLDLDGAVAAVAHTYKKRTNVLRLRLKAGAEYLLQVADERQLVRWVDAINAAGGVDPTKMTSTLPTPRSDFGGGELGGKKKFTTLSRKQK